MTCLCDLLNSTSRECPTWRHRSPAEAAPVRWAFCRIRISRESRSPDGPSRRCFTATDSFPPFKTSFVSVRNLKSILRNSIFVTFYIWPWIGTILVNEKLKLIKSRLVNLMLLMLLYSNTELTNLESPYFSETENLLLN